MPRNMRGLAPQLAFVVAIVTGALADEYDASHYDQSNRAQTLERTVSFFTPSSYSSSGSGTWLTLEVKESVDDFNGIRLRHRSYNGGLVGPIIRVARGSKLRICLRNRLDPENGVRHLANEPHGFNVTNLHTHGLHVSPESPADDVFLEIASGQSFEYTFDIPADHPPGTFWYHAHKHGSTALQLASGMAGALIVEGGLDEVPEIRNCEEKILVLQQFVYRQVPGEAAFVHPDDVYEFLEPRITAVNGIVSPTIHMRPGEVQRWRVIHAGIGDPMNLEIEELEFHEIAIDGIALGTSVARDTIELHPGNRSDVLVKAPRETGTHVVTTKVADARRSARERTIDRLDILKVVVSGAPCEMPLPKPKDLAAYAPLTDADVPSDSELAARREIRMAGGAKFTINESEFDPNTIEIEPRLDTAEEWKIIGKEGGHPFHIHVNPFAVKVPAGDPNPNQWVWRDTLFVEDSDSVSVRIRFKTYCGKTVIHCHMLDHEDQGMMQAIRILPTGSASTKSAAAPRKEMRTAPNWSALDPSTKESVDQSLFGGQVVLLVLHRGVHCVHCARQLALLAEREMDFKKLGANVVAICQFLPDTGAIDVVRTAGRIDFPLLVDPDLAVFKQFECVGDDGVPKHGLFLISHAEHILWSSIDDVAELDMDRVLAQSRRVLNEVIGSHQSGHSKHH